MTYDAGLIKFLEAARSTVQNLEENAAMCIGAGDSTGYVRIMREKAEFLAALADAAQAVTVDPDGDTPATVVREIHQRLQSFSASAAQALRLNSTFYMSALLFAEDHQAGQPNDLDTFTAKIRRTLA